MDGGLARATAPRRAVDGLPEGEGRFLTCSFWLADNLALAGRRSAAEAMFERLLALCNDVGLLAEEYDPRARRQLGNFPQALTHVALINTARNLTRRGGPPNIAAGGRRRARRAPDYFAAHSPVRRAVHVIAVVASGPSPLRATKSSLPS